MSALSLSHTFRIFNAVLDKDHSRLKFVKSLIKILWFVAGNSNFIKICKNIYLITTTIRYCSGSVPIQPFPAEFVPIIQFSIRFWSDLYLSHGKKTTESVPTASRFSRLRSDRDQTVTRQCPSVQIIIGKQKVFFFFLHFHESNLLQKSQPTSSIHGGPVKVLSLNDKHTQTCKHRQTGSPIVPLLFILTFSQHLSYVLYTFGKRGPFSNWGPYCSFCYKSPVWMPKQTHTPPPPPTHTHVSLLYSRREQLSRIWKSTHLESYNCRHIWDDRDTIGTQSYHSLLYRIANGFVWIQSYRVL